MNKVIAALLFIILCHKVQSTYVVSWGGNSYGQLGLGHTTNTLQPTPVETYSNLNVLNIRAGLSTHFAMMSDGNVYCSGNNIYGQLGINSELNQLTPVRNPLAFGLDVYPVGPQTVAYNATTKDVWGWGVDAGYILGSSFSGNQKTPKKSTNADFAGIVIGVSTGWSAAFVMLNGGAYAAGKHLFYSGWNVDTVYKIGTGTTVNQPDFVRMSFWNNVPLQKLFSTGSSHVCGLSKSNSLYCWGKNNYGQLGLGHTDDMPIPTLVSFVDNEDLYVAQLVTGDAHTVILTCGGKVYTWGQNTHGNLGVNSSDNLAHPDPTLVSSLSSLDIVEITSGMHTVFARNATNHWFVWGSRDNNMTLLPINGNILLPTLNPYFRTMGLTHIATNSKNNFAMAWIDPNPLSQRATCPPLFDECLLGMANCSPNAKCVDTERSYKCLCGLGFSGDGRSIETGGTGCNDIDECGTGKCVPQASCHNSLGGFHCTCPDGYEGDGLVNGTACTDINECSAGGYCPPNTECQNSIGSFTCTCSTGYRQIGTSACGPICTDIDECNTLASPCGERRTCNNTAGSFNCPCSPGYHGPSCTDINECVTTAHTCINQQACTNTNGSFYCRCPSGYEGDGVSPLQEGIGCLDINECESNPCDPNASCINGAGIFSCKCNPKFTGNGFTCTDVNECLGTNNCTSVRGICSNTIGGYSCSCEPGFQGNGIKTANGGTACTDVNECLLPNTCDPVATCVNSAGGYTCNCPSGYLGSGKKCYSVNCPIGQYPLDATTCTQCPAGTFNNQTNLEECLSCPAGTYSTGVGKTSQSTCLSCPVNTYSTSGSKACTTCPPGSTSGSGAATCTPCPAGQFGFQGSCKSCGAGYFSSVAGSSECQPCPPGTFSNNSTATSCSPCPPGQVSKGRATSCIRCEAGRYASRAGLCACSQCPPGYSTEGQTGASTCTPCEPGTFAGIAGKTTCSPCPVGAYAPNSGSDGCSVCPPGTFQNVAGQDRCKPCTNWQFSDISGASSCSNCYQGYGAEKEYGSTSCFACPRGTYRTFSDPVCLPCHVGSAADVAGLPHCQLCMGGFHATKCGQATCDACLPGMYSLYKATGSKTCSFCPYAEESFGTAFFCYA